MQNTDKELRAIRNNKVSTTNINDTTNIAKAENATDKAFYVIKIGSFKLTGADIANLSSLSLILYLIFTFTLKSILNSKLILSLAIILSSLVYWFSISFLQIKPISNVNNKNNTNTES